MPEVEPLPPLPRRIPKRPACAGLPEVEVRELANLLIADATAFCRIDANARLMDDYATRYPMKRRPAVGSGGDLND